LADNADEVSEESADACGNVKGDNNFLLLVALMKPTPSLPVNGILFVEEHEVAGSPDGLESNTDDDKEARDEEFSSD